MDRCIELLDKSKLKWVDKSYKHFLNKTTVIYGRTNSGKSTIIEEIMYLCKEHIPTVFVIAPSNFSNNAYSSKIPEQFIFKCIDIEWLDKLLSRQKNSANAYKNSNKLELLKKICDIKYDKTLESLEKSIIEKADSSINFINRSDIEFIHKKNQKCEILQRRDEMLIKIYKNHIRTNRVEIENNPILTKQEKAALGFLNFNPNILLILDDCASKFKKLYKQSSAIKEIFYEGRHYYFTTIISTQDDKEIDSELRKNTSVSIFTTAQAAISNFDRASNGYPKHEKIQAKLCIDAIFKQDDKSLTNYQKLVYIQGSNDAFQYTIANIYDDFRMCSDPLWEYFDKLKQKQNKSKDYNPLYDNYV